MYYERLSFRQRQIGFILVIVLAIITITLWYIEGAIPLSEVFLLTILLCLCICCEFPAYDNSKTEDIATIENE
jgi:hypothetical protein